ncbi:NADH-dependent flavin oxidoreductase [Porphyromonas pogonae]|uniref:NADH-dependent flavin oxidoreductase n=1 Tax=Porphyromonas pogonae TaxID=867595 RepID=UPI002E7760A9|nr:NADH-dependent flavin oxidoreductase [Porphyromonas pogonae]
MKTKELIFSSFRFPKCGIELKNRIVMAPMTTFSGHDDGMVSDEELEYYKERAATAGLILPACAYIHPGGKAFTGQIGADSDDKIPSMRKIADTLKSRGAKVVFQIHHGGRMCPTNTLPPGTLPVSASAVKAERDGLVEPRALEPDEIEMLIEAYAQAAVRAVKAGYEGVEIHGANTYLIQQFFSPHSNRRTDKWGGSLENRMRFPLAVVDAVVEKVRSTTDRPFIIGYRLSPEEIETPGITIEDTLHLVDALANKDLDYLHISTLSFNSPSMRNPEDTRARTLVIKEFLQDRIPLIGVGEVHTPDDAAEILSSGIPLVAMGRELIMEPHWLEKLESGKENEIETELCVDKRKELKVPETMWQMITSRPGWFPTKKTELNMDNF